MRYFYQDVSRQLPGQNPKDTWKAPVVDGMTPPFDPFNAEVPGRGTYEVRHRPHPTPPQPTHPPRLPTHHPPPTPTPNPTLPPTPNPTPTLQPRASPVACGVPTRMSAVGGPEATHTASPTQGWTVRMHGGVYYVYAASSVPADTPNGVHEPSPASAHDAAASPTHALPAGVRVMGPKYHVPSVSQFYNDLNFLLSFAADGPAKSFCFRRLTLLETKFTYADAVPTRPNSCGRADSTTDWVGGRALGMPGSIFSSTMSKKRRAARSVSIA